MRKYSIIFLVVLGVGFAVMAVGLISMERSVRTARNAAAAASTRTNIVVPKTPSAAVTTLPSIAGQCMLGASALFWIFGVLHALFNSSLHGLDKKRWLMITAFVPAMGSLIYFFIAPPPYSQEQPYRHRRHRRHTRGDHSDEL